MRDPVQFNYLKIKNQQKKGQVGALFIEVMVAVTIVGIMGTTIVGFFPRLLSDTTKVKRQAELVTYAKYVGSYVERWSNFSQQSKLAEGQTIDEYNDGEAFDLFGESRINRLHYAEDLTSGVESVDDKYRASIVFWETSRLESAIVRIVVWYDDNNNGSLDSGEVNVPVSMVVSEKYAL